MSEHNFTRRFNPSDDLESYNKDDWMDVSQGTLPKEVLIKYYKKIDWMFYSMHTDVHSLDLPKDVMYYIIDGVNKGTTIREAFDKIL